MLHDPKRKPYYDRSSLRGMMARLLVVGAVIVAFYIYGEAMKFTEPTTTGHFPGPSRPLGR